MYRSFEVRNFRCFRELIVDDLARVNLIAGLNNAGKTALLEALFLYCGAYNPELTLRLSALRGIGVLKLEFGEWSGTPWDSLFRNFDLGQTVVFEGESEAGERRIMRLRMIRQPGELQRTGLSGATGPEMIGPTPLSSGMAQVLELEYEEPDARGSYHMIIDQRGMRVEPIPPAPPHAALYQSDQMRVPAKDMAERFGNLQRQRRGDVVVDALRLIEPRLQRLDLVFEAGEPVLHGDVGIDRLVPLPLMGGGMVRLANLAINLGNAQDGVLLVDEVENGLHHSAMVGVWRAISQVSRKFNIQVFATTHSSESIAAAHTAFSESIDYGFRLIRLDRIKDETRVVTYDKEALETAMETGLEMR